MVFAFVINLPFGYRRARETKRSPMWFLYIHIPIPFVVLMRYYLHMDIRYLPLSLIASVAGQYVGGKL
jgi:hypothetical protein